MANGHKTFGDRYATMMIGVFCTLGSVVYFTQLPLKFARTTEVAALQTQVNKDSAKTAAVVREVKQQTSQAAGSAAVAQAAAQQAQVAAEVVAAHRLFMSKHTAAQINDLDMRLRSLARQVGTNSDQIRAIQQRR